MWPMTKHTRVVILLHNRSLSPCHFCQVMLWIVLSGRTNYRCIHNSLGLLCNRLQVLHSVTTPLPMASTG